MKKATTILLALCSLNSMVVCGQTANRRKVIDILLSYPRIHAPSAAYTSLSSNPTTSVAPPSLCMRSTPGAIPKYTLAKGAIVCRLEEYVQLHSPFKLNIGLDGQ